MRLLLEGDGSDNPLDDMGFWTASNLYTIALPDGETYVLSPGSALNGRNGTGIQAQVAYSGISAVKSAGNRRKLTPDREFHLP
jgi:hypothetical protein